MKTIIIALLIFVVGFFSAKYFYEQKSTPINTIDTAEPENFDTEIMDESDSPSEQKRQNTKDKPKLIDEVTPKTNKLESEINNKLKNDTKLQDYKRQLEALDQKIDKDLSKLKDIAPKEGKDLQDKINEKIDKLPGDDKLTEKEYE